MFRLEWEFTNSRAPRSSVLGVVCNDPRYDMLVVTPIHCRFPVDLPGGPQTRRGLAGLESHEVITAQDIAGYFERFVKFQSTSLFSAVRPECPVDYMLRNRRGLMVAGGVLSLCYVTRFVRLSDSPQPERR